MGKWIDALGWRITSIVVVMVLVVGGCAGFLVFATYTPPDAQASVVEVARNLSIIAAAVVGIPIVIVSLWLREKSLEEQKKRPGLGTQDDAPTIQS